MNETNKKAVQHSEIAPAAYDRILDRLRRSLDEAGETTWESLQSRITEAIELEMAAEAMTRDEMDLLNAYIERDLKQIGYYAHEAGEGIAAWLNFDLNALETAVSNRLWDLADKTRVQHELLREQLSHDDQQYLAGEITLPGRLVCVNCGEHQLLIRSAAIEPCEECHGVIFERSPRFLPSTEE